MTRIAIIGPRVCAAAAVLLVAARLAGAGAYAQTGGPSAPPGRGAVTMRTIDATWPAPPGEESWAFVDDLKKPLPSVLFWKEGSAPRPGQVDLLAGLSFRPGFPDPKGILKTADDHLTRFLAFSGLAREGGLPVTTEMVPTDVPESYTIEVTPKGIRLLAGDTEGIRRALYELEEVISAADGPFLDPVLTRRRPWVKNRITRASSGRSSARRSTAMS